MTRQNALAAITEAVTTEELEEIPDEARDPSMWSDAEHEGFGPHGRHASEEGD
jgi:hypothetical protein